MYECECYKNEITTHTHTHEHTHTYIYKHKYVRELSSKDSTHIHKYNKELKRLENTLKAFAININMQNTSHKISTLAIQMFTHTYAVNLNLFNPRNFITIHIKINFL